MGLNNITEQGNKAGEVLYGGKRKDFCGNKKTGIFLKDMSGRKKTRDMICADVCLCRYVYSLSPSGSFSSVIERIYGGFILVFPGIRQASKWQFMAVSSLRNLCFYSDKESSKKASFCIC